MLWWTFGIGLGLTVATCLIKSTQILPVIPYTYTSVTHRATQFTQVTSQVCCQHRAGFFPHDLFSDSVTIIMKNLVLCSRG
ncbi:hypothetical protein F5Y16DRAFT_6688 [Xylariaceae sp. FL0255]|nr:hypothetical protein F5Y16DRAFT_6688 [Xylariaceae sp. FL0255]